MELSPDHFVVRTPFKYCVAFSKTVSSRLLGHLWANRLIIRGPIVCDGGPVTVCLKLKSADVIVADVIVKEQPTLDSRSTELSIESLK
jgi:hypothetical protein